MVDSKFISFDNTWEWELTLKEVKSAIRQQGSTSLSLFQKIFDAVEIPLNDFEQGCQFAQNIHSTFAENPPVISAITPLATGYLESAKEVQSAVIEDRPLLFVIEKIEQFYKKYCAFQLAHNNCVTTLKL